MVAQGLASAPVRSSYDVVIIGGAIMGSSTAWFLSDAAEFDGTVLVIERDPSYARSATALSNSCIRQQFSEKLNIQISQFAADYMSDFPARMRDDPRVPGVAIQSYGYLYLAETEAQADVLRRNHAVQRAAGVATELLEPDEIARRYPFYELDGIRLGSINTRNEGYFDGGTMFEWWRRKAREAGVEYVANEVVAMALNAAGTRVESVTLATGQTIACGQVVNASGTRGAKNAAMAGIELPLEPRKRFSWVFTAETPLNHVLPLTIDPSGVHMRQDGPTTYLAGSRGFTDEAVDLDDFTMDHALWEQHVWPILATRIPQFEAIRVVNEWAGHYDYNTLDQNAIHGPHPLVTNFFLINGFSGHGLQQSPAMGRGMAELLTHGAYQTLDLSPFGFDRILAGQCITELAVI